MRIENQKEALFFSKFFYFENVDSICQWFMDGFSNYFLKENKAKNVKSFERMSWNHKINRLNKCEFFFYIDILLYSKTSLQRF